MMLHWLVYFPDEIFFFPSLFFPSSFSPMFALFHLSYQILFIWFYFKRYFLEQQDILLQQSHQLLRITFHKSSLQLFACLVLWIFESLMILTIKFPDTEVRFTILISGIILRTISPKLFCLKLTIFSFALSDYIFPINHLNFNKNSVSNSLAPSDSLDGSHMFWLYLSLIP